jgi:hypothetical protein
MEHLYSPQVGPTLRKTVDADRVRKAKFFAPEPPPEAKPKTELLIVVRDNKAALCRVANTSERDWIEAASNAMATTEFMVTIRSIQRVVCKFYGVSQMDLRSARKTQPVTRYRQIAMYLCKELTTNSMPAIGRQFNGRDHTTVLHSFRRIDRLRKTDAAIDDQIKSLVATIMAKPEPASC